MQNDFWQVAVPNHEAALWLEAAIWLALYIAAITFGLSLIGRGLRKIFRR